MKLKDKVGIVTGATKGIGVAVAEEFVKEGARVVVTGRTVDLGEKGKAALEYLFDRAFEKGIITEKANLDILEG